MTKTNKKNNVSLVWMPSIQELKKTRKITTVTGGKDALK